MGRIIIGNDSEVVNTILTTPHIVSRILQFVPKNEVLKFRFVSKAFDEAFQYDNSCHFCIGIRESEGDVLNEVFDRILESSVKWQRFSLKNLNFRTNPVYLFMLEAIFGKYKSTMKRVTFLDCEISCSQFIQVLSIPERMEELRIVHTVGPYSGGLELVRVAGFMKSFHQNMSKLKRIQLTDESGQYNPLVPWLLPGFHTPSGATQLVELITEMSGYQDPNSPPKYILSEHLRDIFRQTYATLKHLSLAFVRLENTIFIGMSKLSLKHLSFQKCLITDPVMFNQFLQNQAALEIMAFSHMKITNVLFNFAECLISLKTLSFQHCDYEALVLQRLGGIPKLQIAKFIGNPKDQEHVHMFLTSPMATLKTLTLRLGSGTDTLFELVGKNCNNLEDMDANGIGNISVKNMRHIWGLNKLRRLILSDTNFGDSEFPIPAPGVASINCLQDLQILDLSNSNADDNMTRLLIQLEKVTSVCLRNTMITEEGLAEISRRFAGHLITLDVSDCTNCVISKESFEIYEDGLCNSINCQFTCDKDEDFMELNSTSISSIGSDRIIITEVDHNENQSETDEDDVDMNDIFEALELEYPTSFNIDEPVGDFLAEVDEDQFEDFYR